MKFYEVGGCVRDELMGIESKDIDFSVVMEPGDITRWEHFGVFDPYEIMVKQLEGMGINIFKDKDGKPVGADFFTARGLAPKTFPKYPGRALDFVMARKEGSYSDGRRPDYVEAGTLEDDLARRDFTMNAIAKDEDGNYIDPFNGRQSIEDKVIRAVGDPFERLTEDALRAIRAVRFAVTKDFEIQNTLWIALQHPSVLNDIAGTRISDERIKEELNKMLSFSTVETLSVLNALPYLTEAMFSGTVSLEATMKQRGKS